MHPKTRIRSLCQDFAGVLAQPRLVPMTQFVDRSLSVVNCPAGCMSFLSPEALYWNGKATWGWWGLSGAACEDDAELAEFKAVCEAAERYSTALVHAREWRVASAEELGEEALDWRRLPCLSAAELKLPGQVFTNFDPTRRIRWVKSVDLCAGRARWVPVVYTHLYPRPWTAERFWSPITTGTAVHTDPVKAVVSAIGEVLERDAIALNWLLQRPLERIVFAERSRAIVPSWARPLLYSGEITLYNATTDLGVPTVYARRCRPEHPRAANVVSCSSGFDVEQAALKALREVLMISSTIERREGSPPDTPLQCISIDDGARYMARASQTPAFAFLDQGGSVPYDTLLERFRDEAQLTPAAQLKWLVERLGRRGAEVLVSELTVDELREVGLRCFHATIPSLMPMSCVFRCRYLGSARLRQYHEVLGLPGPLENAINPHPQPFA